MKIYISATIIVLNFLSIGCANLQQNLVKSEKTFYISGCKIFNYRLEPVRVLTGHSCLPLADGSWVAFEDTSLTKYSPHGEAIWTKSGYYHHQIKLSSDLYIYVLSSHAKIYKNNKIKFDTVLKYDLDGNLIGEFDLFREMYITKTLDDPVFFYGPTKVGKAYEKYFPGTNYEQLHLNAINFYKDDLIINTSNFGTFLLDKNLKFIKVIPDYVNFYNKILCPLSNCHSSQHDFQILEDGTNLLFKNINASSDKKSTTFKIYEFKETLLFEFPIEKKDEVENSGIGGGVQKLSDGTYLVGFPTNNQSTLIGLISKDKGWIQKAPGPKYIQDIKIIPYDNFMKLNKIR